MLDSDPKQIAVQINEIVCTGLVQRADPALDHDPQRIFLTLQHCIEDCPSERTNSSKTCIVSSVVCRSEALAGFRSVMT